MQHKGSEVRLAELGSISMCSESFISMPGILQLRSLEWSGMPNATLPARTSAKASDVILTNIGNRQLIGPDELRRFAAPLILSINVIALGFLASDKSIRSRFCNGRAA